ncbi:MAG: Lipopolysaccharide biosynthesis chain length determinant protein [Labilithrix sp.]|nr:Lipopolysaccharide biosynthesis chain length determinant protein [Labilithrix sp.]
MASGTPRQTKAPRTIREELDRLLVSTRRGLAFWKRSLAVFFVVSGIAAAIVMLAPRAYKSETVILYQETMRAGDLMGGTDSANENARRVGARLREVLLSRATLEPLITELRLYRDIVDKRGLVDGVDEMRKHVAFRAREGDTFEIAFESDTPERAQEVTRRLAGVIVQEAATRRTEQAKTLKEFLDAESERNKIDLRAKDGELAKFLALHPEFARPTTSDVHSAAPPTFAPGVATLGDPMLAALEWKASRIERQLKAGSGKVEPAPPKPRPGSTRLPDSPELVAARRDVEDKAGRFTEKHPDVIAARARLRSAEAAQAAAQAAADQAAAAAANGEDTTPVPPATDENREALTKQLADLKAQIAARRASAPASAAGTAKRIEPSADKQTGTAVDLEVEFRRLQREANDVRERQRQLDDKSFKASIAASSAMNDRNIQVSVLDAAYLPTHPSSLPRSTKLAVGLGIALILAFLTALISARFDDRIHDRGDLELLDVLPVIGIIPRPKALPRKTG